MTPKRPFRGDFSGGILAKVTSDGKVEMLILGVLKKDLADRLRAEGRSPGIEHMDIKLPGGCANTQEATPGEVFLEEIREECFEGKCTLGPSLVVFERRKPNYDNPHGPDHVQRFFLVTRWEGELRKRDMLEDEGDEELSPPVFVEFRELYLTIFGTHQEPIFRAVEALAKKDRQISEEYGDLLADFQAGKIRPKFRKLGK